MGNLFDGVWGERARKVVFVVLLLLGVLLAVQAVAAVKGWRYIGAGLNATNTITVSGHGEAVAVPDIATFSFSVVSDKSTVAAAQTEATAKVNAITSYLTSAGIDKKDIQTSDYGVSPQYEYSQSICPAAATGGVAIYCPPGKQVLKGYEVRQTTTIKVRDTAKAGEILTAVGEKGATEVSGLNFTFDKPDTVQDEARNKAITNAKTKAEVLAKSLGVDLVRVVSYSENGSGYPTPMYYAKDLAAGNGVSSQAAVAPTISTGENKVNSDVNVTYEIR